MSNIFEQLWDAIKSFFSGSEIQAIGSKANQLINAFKTLDESTVGQFLEHTIEAIYPASTGILDAVHIALPQALKDLNLVNADIVGKNDGEVILAGLAALNNLKTTDPVLYAGTLGTLSQKIQTIEAGATGILLSSDQAAVNAVISHNPNIIN